MHVVPDGDAIGWPGEIDDDATTLLAHEIARDIEGQLDYPGQIRITVIRESRSTEYAK